jgi:hypothetical protein
MMETLPIVHCPLPADSGHAPARSEIASRGSTDKSGFSVVELLVAMTLLTLIVIALMAVFSSTQRAFRASVTQTDVLEGSRAAVELIASDLRTMVPSDGPSNYVFNGFFYPGTVNFFVQSNAYASCSYVGPKLACLPMPQALPGGTARRTNVLNYFFLLGRQNTTWTGVGYVVNATNSNPLYPLYRFFAQTNINVSPYTLFNAFVNAVNQSQWTNMSHVMDGVVHLTVRPYDPNGFWMTNNFELEAGQLVTNKNVWFMPSYAGEVGCFMFSNMVPSAVEFQLGVLEDRALQRAESLGIPGTPPALATAQWTYLQSQSGHVHLFRQRVNIPNFDPSAYQ